MTTAEDIQRLMGSASPTDLARAFETTQRAVKYHDELFLRLHNLVVAPTPDNRNHALALLNKIRKEVAST